MSSVDREIDMIRMIDEKMSELDRKLEALEYRKKDGNSKKCSYPMSEIGSAFNYLNQTTTQIGDDFQDCLIATHSKKDALKCLHNLTNSLSKLDCNKITTAMKKCKDSTSIPDVTLNCLDKAFTSDQVNACIGKSFHVKLYSHIAKFYDSQSKRHDRK